MPKGIEDVDARFSALRLALQAIVDALTEKRVIERTDITNRLRNHEKQMDDSAESHDLTHQLRELRRLLE